MSGKSESIGSNASTGDDSNPNGDNYSTPVNSPSPSIPPAASRTPDALPPTREELKGWCALVSYIKHRKEAELLETAIRVLMETYEVEQAELEAANAAAQHAQNELRSARLAAQMALDGHEETVKASTSRLLQALQLVDDCRIRLRKATLDCEETRYLLETNESSVASHVASKKFSEGILMTIQSLGVFSVGNSKYSKHLLKHLPKILRDGSFNNIKTIALIPPSSGHDHNLEVCGLNIAAEAERAGRVFVVRAPKSPPRSPTLSPTPSPPKEEVAPPP